MRFIQKLKAIWLVLVSYNYLVCTTKDKGTKVEFRSSYRFIPNKGMSRLHLCHPDRCGEENQ